MNNLLIYVHASAFSTGSIPISHPIMGILQCVRLGSSLHLSSIDYGSHYINALDNYKVKAFAFPNCFFMHILFHCQAAACVLHIVFYTHYVQVGNCVAKRNYRYFYLFLVTMMVGTVYVMGSNVAVIVIGTYNRGVQTMVIQTITAGSFQKRFYHPSVKSALYYPYLLST